MFAAMGKDQAAAEYGRNQMYVALREMSIHLRQISHTISSIVSTDNCTTLQYLYI